MSGKRPAKYRWLDQVTERVGSKRLSSSAGHVALVLGVHYVNGANQAWPSQGTLASRTGLGLRTVVRALAELERAGLLEIEHRQRAGNRYQLRFVAEPGNAGGVLET